MVFVSDDQATRDVIKEALANVDHQVITVDAPDCDKFLVEEDTFLPLAPFAIPSMDVPLLTIHSSGKYCHGWVQYTHLTCSKDPRISQNLSLQRI